MEIQLITFETYQALSFTLAGSLFLYMTIAYLTWFAKGLRPKKRPVGAIIHQGK